MCYRERSLGNVESESVEVKFQSSRSRGDVYQFEVDDKMDFNRIMDTV